MKIAVIGATGRTGKQFVLQALEKGHQVTVLVRSPNKLEIEHAQLRVIVGDVLNITDAHSIVNGQDAVFIALGAAGKSTIRADGTEQIVKAMVELGEGPHLVVVSSLGVDESRAQMSFLVRMVIPFILRDALADHLKQERHVRQSGLPWTILRPTALGDGLATGRVTATLPPQHVKAQPPVSRADVAAFALSVLENHSHLQQAVTLTASTD